MPEGVKIGLKLQRRQLEIVLPKEINTQKLSAE